MTNTTPNTPAERAERILNGPKYPARLRPWEQRCTRCREVRHRETDFSTNHSGAYRSPVCKPCKATESRARYAKRNAAG